MLEKSWEAFEVVSRTFEVVVFTASQQSYADQVSASSQILHWWSEKKSIATSEWIDAHIKPVILPYIFSIWIIFNSTLCMSMCLCIYCIYCIYCTSCIKWYLSFMFVAPAFPQEPKEWIVFWRSCSQIHHSWRRTVGRLEAEKLGGEKFFYGFNMFQSIGINWVCLKSGILLGIPETHGWEKWS